MSKKRQEADDTIEYAEFDPAWIRFDDTVLLLGPRKKGKTVGAREILLSANKPPRGMIQVGSSDGLKSWSDNLPLLFLHESDTIDEALFTNWMSIQKEKVIEIEIEVKGRLSKWLEKSNAKLDAAMKKEHQALIQRSETEKWSNRKLLRKQGKLKAKYDALADSESARLYAKKEALYDRMVLPESCFCGFDDLGEEKKGVMNHKLLQILFSRGRHYGALVLVIAQYAKHLGAASRSGVNWLLIWPGSLGPEDMKKVIEDYIPGVMLSQKQALRTFKAITDKDSKNAMVIWRSNPNSTKAQDCIFYWNPIKSIARRRGKSTMFGDSNLKLYSDLFYNGKHGYIQKIPERNNKRPPALPIAPSPTPASSSVPVPESDKAEERKKIIESFGKKETIEPAGAKVEKMFNKQAVNRWKKAESRKKRSTAQPPPPSNTTYTTAGTSMTGMTLNALPVPAPAAIPV